MKMAKGARNRWRHSSRYGTGISLDGIEAYLNRTLDDWLWIKSRDPDLIHEELEAAGVPFHTKPRAYQAACTLIGTIMPAFAYFLDPGMGKSKIILDLTSWRKQQGLIGRTLILCLTEIAAQNWVEQIKEHAPHLSYTMLFGNRDTRLALLEEETDISLLNYPGLQAYMTYHDKVKKRMLPDKGMVSAFASKWDQLILDESHTLGNPHTLVYTLVHAISRHAQFRYALTGTAFGRDPMLLWSQMDVIDHGESLGRTLGLFRTAFFAQKENYWGGMEYTFRQRMKNELSRLLQHRSITYEASEVKDLPPVSRIPILVKLPEDAKAMYENVVSELKSVYGNYTATENSFLRMRQISSGYLTAKMKDDEGKEIDSMEMVFDCPKLEALMELLNEIPENEKVVVFHEFIPSGKRISDTLKAEGISHVRLWGGSEDKPEILTKFLRDPKCRILVANHKVGGTSLNLQVSRYIIFFESPVSPITRTQAENRCTGMRQSQHSFIYDLVTRGTVDEDILKFAKEGRDLRSEICSGKIRYEQLKLAEGKHEAKQFERKASIGKTDQVHPTATR